MEIIQIILTLFVLFAISRAYLRLKDKQIRLSEFFFWMAIWIGAMVSILSPSTIGYVSQTFGIGRPADLILYVAVILLFYLIFRLYVSIDGIKEDMTKIIRELAIKKGKKK